MFPEDWELTRPTIERIVSGGTATSAVVSVVTGVGIADYCVPIAVTDAPEDVCERVTQLAGGRSEFGSDFYAGALVCGRDEPEIDLRFGGLLRKEHIVAACNRTIPLYLHPVIVERGKT